MKNIRATGISTVAAISIIVIMTIWSELSQQFKDLLTNLTGHHWVTKSMTSIILFFGLYFSLRGIKDKEEVAMETAIVILTAILATLAIFFFYVYEFFIH